MEYKHQIDLERCKGCGLCVAVCPKNALEISETLNNRGYFPVWQSRPGDCVYCTMCGVMCPDVAISIIGLESHSIPEITEKIMEEK